MTSREIQGAKWQRKGLICKISQHAKVYMMKYALEHDMAVVFFYQQKNWLCQTRLANCNSEQIVKLLNSILHGSSCMTTADQIH